MGIAVLDRTGYSRGAVILSAATSRRELSATGGKRASGAENFIAFAVKFFRGLLFLTNFVV
jgi:hypothetical protein